MTPEEMLEQRHTLMLEWHDPWPACGPEGNDLSAHVTYRALVHDCINMARLVAREKGRPTLGNDREFLLDFIAVHWAEPISNGDYMHQRGITARRPCLTTT